MSPWVLLLIAPAILLAFLASQLPPDGKDHDTFVHFLGRFHPVFLHLPIGLLALVPLLALFGRKPERAHLRAAVPFVMVATTVSALLATALGWMLAWAGAYEGDILVRHQWGGVIFCVLSAVTTWAVGRGILFPILLTISLGTLCFVAHDGGTLTHGDTFLTQHMPQGLRSLFGLPELPKKTPKSVTSATTGGSPSSQRTTTTQPLPATAGSTPAAGVPTYAAVLAPIFEKKCVSCHKPEKKKGELLMTSYEALLEGGDTGPSLVPGDLEKSELWRRITLSPDHDEYMPSDGKPPLTKEEVALVKAWIAGGAPKG